MPKTAELVWLYVKQHPYIQEALERKIVNYSALARIINKQVKANPEAVKAALLRISKKLIKQRKAAEQKILKIIKGSTLEVKSKIAVVIAKEFLDIPVIAVAKGPSAVTHIVEEKYTKGLKSVLKIQKNLDLVAITSPEDLETTPGVTAYILSVIGAENINLVEVISCYTDTLLVTNQADTAKVFDILSKKLR